MVVLGDRPGMDVLRAGGRAPCYYIWAGVEAAPAADQDPCSNDREALLGTAGQTCGCRDRGALPGYLALLHDVVGLGLRAKI
ncbi:hypothetical protein P154DRAFT_330058 [Amniculicola lignicola CBS 123094]|uniref:Uncharacterized protein n=1 Tax=Amniculicola lignicola CBS 123094 TaxID=1392246 RepID=A0A6A5W292_9PLEO|nr:hypothetical protein P154DRAFT_330058 [Amniculicola lignicola CBS 123094]